jgi:deazaflavin-dependent oxidoreductase (nitroreductase family)
VWYYTPSPRALTWITKIHRALYRATGGIVGSRLPQLEESRRGIALRLMNVLLLTTQGRKSGTPRTVPLPCFICEGRTFLVGSFAGLDRNPAWYANVVERPEVEVQRGARRQRARAVTLSGNERARIWAMIVEDWPRYRMYQSGTQREIPVVELI